MSKAAETRHSRRAILTIVVAIALALGAVVQPVTGAQAATNVIEFDTLRFGGDDLTPGDGRCVTAEGDCTLRAALQEANTAPVGQQVMVTPAPGVEGTIVASGAGADNRMSTAALSTMGDNGAFFALTRTIILDFQGQVGLEATDADQDAAMFLLNGANSSVRNFTNVSSARTAFVVGAQGAGSSIVHGACSDEGQGVLARCLWLATGAHRVTMDRVRVGSPLQSGGSAIRLAAAATVNDLTLSNLSFTNPDGQPYSAFGAMTTATVSNLRIIGSRFERFSPGSVIVNFTGVVVNNSRISQNTFVNNPAADAMQPVILVGRAGTNTQIIDNVFHNDIGSERAVAIRANGMGIGANTVSGWEVLDNNFDGFTGPNTVWLGASSGRWFVARNSFGARNPDGADAASEASQGVLLFNDTNSNMQVRTWFPSEVTRSGECELSVRVQPPTSGTAPQVPLVLNLYFTAKAQAEQALASFPGITTATTIRVPFTGQEGFLRVQTFGSGRASSQYSRTIEIPKGASDAQCRPIAEVERSPMQDEATGVRDMDFRVNFSETIPGELRPAAIDFAGTTAPGARVVGIDRLSVTSFAVRVRVDGSGSVVLGVKEDAVADVQDNLSLAGKGTDQSTVEYTSPLAWEHKALEVSKGDEVEATIISSLPATSPLHIRIREESGGWVTVDPEDLVMRAFDSRGTVTVQAKDDREYSGDRKASIKAVVRSDDPTFDGLELSSLGVDITEVNQPSASLSSLGSDDTTRVADGRNSHEVTVTVRNDRGRTVTSSPVVFSAAPELRLSSASCVTDDVGECKVEVTSVAVGTFEMSAHLVTGETIEAGPVSLRFVAGEAAAERSRIVADRASLRVDGGVQVRVTATLYDQSGHRIEAGGDTVEMFASSGTLSDVEDQGDGTYSALYSTPEITGVATISFDVNGERATDTALIVLEPGVPSPELSLLTVKPYELVADGVQDAGVHIELRDGYGNQVDRDGYDVSVEATSGTVSELTDIGGGSFEATLTAPREAGSAVVSFAIAGATAADTQEVAFVPGVADTTTSEITATPTELVADGVRAAIVGVRLRDAQGNPLTAGGDEVTLASSYGDLSDVVDVGNGNYIATLQAPTKPGSTSITFHVNGDAAEASADVEFVVGLPNLIASTFTVAPVTLVADGESTAEITLIAKDAFGNRLPGGGLDVAFPAEVGSVSDIIDHGDGAYTATLTSQQTAASGDVAFMIGADAGRAITVQMVPGAAVAERSSFTVNPDMLPASGEDWARVQVTLRDANDNVVSGGSDRVEATTDLGSFGEFSPETGRAYLSSTRAGVATVGLRVNGGEVPQQEPVTFLPGPADPEHSLLQVDPTRVVADGLEESNVEVRVRDRHDNPVTGDVPLKVTSSLGDVAELTRGEGGLWSATLTSTRVGRATVGFSLYGVASDQEKEVEFVHGPVDLLLSTLEATPLQITANGVASSELLVSLVDAHGNPVTSGAEVTGLTDLGNLSAAKNLGNGEWSCVLTSRISGTAQLGFAVNGQRADAAEEVQIVPGPVDPVASSISAAPALITANGSESSEIVVDLRDTQHNPILLPHEVTMHTTLGTLSGVESLENGSYRATLTGVRAGQAAVSFAVDGTTMPTTARVRLAPGPTDLAHSTLNVAPSERVADGRESATVTIELRDTQGNLIESSGGVVQVNSTLGVVAPVTDHGDGRYTASLTSTIAGTATIEYVLDGVRAPQSVQLQFLPGVANVTASSIETSPSRIVADGVAASQIRVTLRDVNGNAVITENDTVTIASTLGAVTGLARAGGAWTAQLSGTVSGHGVVDFTVNGVPSPHIAYVELMPGAPNPNTSTIVATPSSVVADGVAASAVTVTLRDAFGNLVTDGAVVGFTTNFGEFGAATHLGDGRWNAPLRSVRSGTASVGFTINAAAAAGVASVSFVPGPADMRMSTFASDPHELTANGIDQAQVSLTLFDRHANRISVGGQIVSMATDVGTLSAPIDHGDGTWGATLTAPTSTTPQYATVRYTIAGQPGEDTAMVAFVSGIPDGDASEIVVQPNLIVANGSDAATVTVTLRDGFGNVVTDAEDVVGMTTTLGSVSAVTNHGDGTYTASVTSIASGEAIIQFSVSEMLASPRATVQMVPGSPDPGRSLLAVSPDRIVANNISTAAAAVTLFDVHGNRVRESGHTVAIASTDGVVGSVIDTGGGSYTAMVTSAAAPGTATLSFELNSVSGGNTAQLEFVRAMPDANRSTIVTIPDEMGSEPGDEALVRVTLLDSSGRPLTHGGDAVIVDTTLGVLESVTDQGDGSYTTKLSSLAAGTATLTFTVNEHAGDQDTIVIVHDTTPPDAPVVTAPTARAKTRPLFVVAGTGEADARLTLRADGRVVCVTVVRGDKTWSCTPMAPLAKGERTLTAFQTDLAGNIGAYSADHPVTVSEGIAAPRPDRSNGVLFSGDAESDSVVTVRDATTGTLLCVSTHVHNASFECQPDRPVAAATEVSFVATDRIGNVSVPAKIVIGEARFALTHETVSRDEQQAAVGTGFIPGEEVTATLYSTPQKVAAVRADEAGRVEFSFAIPRGLDYGEHSVTLTSALSESASDSFELVPQPLQPLLPVTPVELTHSSTPGLSATGGEPPVGIGMLLFALGLILAAAGVYRVERRLRAR